jgi:hypothetical protein
VDAKCICGETLRQSVTMKTRSERLKSCPECSGRRGRHVFYREEAFGSRDMGDGREIIQSWCPECRAGTAPSGTSAYECK